MAEKRMTVTMTRGQALALDILRCTCGHRPNNHFEHGERPCAFCDCKALDEVLALPAKTVSR